MRTYAEDLDVALALSDFPSWERKEIFRLLYEHPMLKALRVNPFGEAEDAGVMSKLWKLTKEIAEDYRHRSDTRPFPIQPGTPYRREGVGMVYPKESQVPWWLAEIAYNEYHRRYPNSQTMERLAERGGFGREELLDFLRGEPASR